MTTPAPTQPLTPAEQRISQLLVDGLPTHEIASTAGLKLGTVKKMLTAVRWKLHCPQRSPLAVVVHRLLGTGLVTAPAPKRPAPELTPEQTILLSAVAEHPLPRDIALATRLAPADLSAALEQLLDDVGAHDSTELVVLAYSWQLLPLTRGSHPTRSGARQ
ncbi:LuxR C-terminal-related transcriptional regulator [Streptomyces sp. NPDC048518]|uniref:LuxR C-terminal-related transcriptional regulator n=1 Tax=Streptomyces sp. NPDC048518 TaxID=3155029 RepID=UPI0033DBF4D2